MKNFGLKYGLILAAISIIQTIVVYAINPRLFVDPGTLGMVASVLISVVLMVLAVRAKKQAKGGFIPFGEAFASAFMTFFIGTTISTIFMALFVNFFDPSLIELFEEVGRENFKTGLESGGMTEAQIMEQMENVDEKMGFMGKPFSPVFSIFTILSGMIMGLPIAAVIAAILKKEEPMPVV